MADVDTVRAELTAHPELYSGLSAAGIADAMNAPRQTGTATTYRAVTVSEVAGVATTGLVKVQKAAGDYEAAETPSELAAALPGAAVAAALTVAGSIAVEPASPGRALLDAAVPTFLTTGELAAIVTLGTIATPVLQTLWQAWGWTHSVSIALVQEAQS